MSLADLAISLMEALGGPGIALVIAAEALFPPVPGEFLLPFTGVTAAATGQNVLVPIFWTTLGSVLGGLLVYGAGRALGLRRTRALVARIPLLDAADVDTAVRFFDRFGFPAVMLARFVPMVRTFISVPAGIERMRVISFVAATGLGSGIWNAAFVLAGYLFGIAGGEALESFVRTYSLVLAVVGLLGIAVFARRRLRARRSVSRDAAG
ncbi:membrane protein [Brachybacterium phenoliresistens]|uniref:Membrane protein n=1 Tax=Brachybacterium phenoliresistens TaxID=396014 RepID=Z9JUQ0_9MICO|nr:DedA family protein [Brachybacterium phenoliresistens]EWS82080.1 membrane protein [Brachybacterium phenoliresistens]